MRLFSMIVVLLMMQYKTFGQCSLFFSEYGEGSSTNKWIEVYNPTSNNIDLAQYAIELYPNGSLIPYFTYELNGTILPNETYTITDANVQLDSLAIISNYAFGQLSYNGNDVLMLVNILNDTIVDVIGQYGEIISANVGWTVDGIVGATKDHTLIRNSFVTQGNLDWADSSQSEWSVFPQNYIENAGQHTFTGICAISTTCWNPDANEDGIVGMTDLLQLLAWFGTNSPVCD